MPPPTSQSARAVAGSMLAAWQASTIVSFCAVGGRDGGGGKPGRRGSGSDGHARVLTGWLAASSRLRRVGSAKTASSAGTR